MNEVAAPTQPQVSTTPADQAAGPDAGASPGVATDDLVGVGGVSTDLANRANRVTTSRKTGAKGATAASGRAHRITQTESPSAGRSLTPEAGETVAISPEDGWALLDGLRRRLDDQGIQARSTQQQVTQLTESIAALVEIQRRRTHGINLNSFVAYLIFTILCGAGFYFLYHSRANELVAARDGAVRERDTAVKRAEELAAGRASREQADTRAWEVYQLLESGKRAEAVAKLEALRGLPLSRTERAILAARAHETQVKEVDAALKGATVSFKAGRYQEVIAPLEAALVLESTGSRAASMRYYLGIAHAKAGTFDKAIGYLLLAHAGDVEHDDARFHLASALDRSGAWARARAEYDRFATAFPQSQLAVYATRRSAALSRLPARAPTPAPPKPAPQPAPVAPKAAAPKPAATPPAVSPPTAPPMPAAGPKTVESPNPSAEAPAPKPEVFRPQPTKLDEATP